MQTDSYDVPEWEAWAIPAAEGVPARLRITSAFDLPFEGSALLRVSLTEEGFVFSDRDAGVDLIFGPPPQPATRELFATCLAYQVPVVLTEVHFAEKVQRTWLARAVA